MTTISDLFPANCGCAGDPVEQAIGAGHVRQQVHPSEPLAILNYTELCSYQEAWTPVTLACRGLIYRTDTGEVVARGFEKFFNYGQAGAPTIPLDTSVIVTDKADGSLGIVYPLPSGGWAVATRGSFASEQALHATALLNSRYAGYRPRPELTTLVEVIYPGNRIVLDYGELDDLVLLGGQPLAGGMPVPAASMQAAYGWPGPATSTLLVGSFAEALALPSRPAKEGVVVLNLLTGDMVKIKEPVYVELHRIVTNLTARKIHDHLVAGKPIADFTAPLPDEFHPWCTQVADDIEQAVNVEGLRLQAGFDLVVAGLQAQYGWSAQQMSTDRQSRRVFALKVGGRPDSWAMFAQLDGRDIRPELLKRARPEASLTPTGRTYTEDNA